MEHEEIIKELTTALEEICEAAHYAKGMQLVVGCSTSEVSGGRIGKNSVPELGPVIAGCVLDFCREREIAAIFQCCEHLNRSLVMEKEDALRFGYTRVCAVPQPKAGGSVPAAAWKLMHEPTLVMHVAADMGLDIGDTLIGMHLRPVAVPFRGTVKRIGEANLVMAFSRLPYIGGERAKYE